eukprot:TRINITY_DN23011_c0_g1_i1.p1 TRINITY_DN23011_c0_g1~~TRINITY_DN23011_c0_g1_i1.p1  ORF type:complete len:246 (+),score=43.18 TRINITY_DN23011_c0_g1_i1:72-809(+)
MGKWKKKKEQRDDQGGKTVAATKGQVRLQQYKEASPERPLPVELVKEAVLKFDLAEIDIPGAVAKLLGLKGADELPGYVLSLEDQGYGTAASFPQVIHSRARADEVVGPHLLEFFPGESVLFYQWPPTIRVHCPSSRPLGRMHNDAQYGHQPGEVNFWMPLVHIQDNSTLWVESVSGLEDWHPILIVPGEIWRFHGTSCRHFSKPNDTGGTRVSIDFRCAVKSAFDSTWQLPGLVHRHELLEMHF